MTHDEDDYWFPAKAYGWGWGLPVRWQGWAVTVLYLLLLLGSGVLLPGGSRSAAFGILTLILIGICWWKGESPGWRWGR